MAPPLPPLPTKLPLLVSAPPPPFAAPFDLVVDESPPVPPPNPELLLASPPPHDAAAPPIKIERASPPTTKEVRMAAIVELPAHGKQADSEGFPHEAAIL